MTLTPRHLLGPIADTRALDELAASVTGTLHTPHSSTWDAARTPWAVHVDQTPLAVLEVADSADVERAVAWAGRHGVPVTAQPVGHGATWSLDRCLLLRTRALRTVEVDVERRTAVVGAGVKAGELLAALDGTGLTFLAGSNPDPSVVGMTITGGISWFGRAYGVGSDSLLAVDLVDGTGRPRHLTAAGTGEDAELFWAVRGGGGDFGIITSVELALHPAPQLYGGRLLWPLDRIREVLVAFAEVTRHAPRELSTWFHAYRFPPLPELPEPIRGRSFASVAAVHLGSAEEAERLLAPLRAVDGVELDLLGPVPVTDLGGVAAEPTDPMPSVEHSALLDRLDDAAIDRLVALVGSPSGDPLAVLQVRHLGGAFTDHVPGGGSHGPVPEPYALFAMGVPVSPEAATAITGTFAALDGALAEHTSGRTLLNFLGSHGDPGRWWSPSTRERLGRAKLLADPWDLVRSNRPVRP